MILLGDCLERLKELEADSVDAVVTDPPYGLKFMGKKWDYDVPSKELWSMVLHVLKPGGHVLSFGGTRTYHRMALAIEEAGFEIRDQLQWLYGSGFPKSHNIGDGIGTALKPANEPIVLARKPLEKGLTVAKNVLRWGTGALNIDASRIGYSSEADKKLGQSARPSRSKGMEFFTEGEHDQFDRSDRSAIQGRWPANLLLDETAAAMLDEQSGHLGAAGNKKITDPNKYNASSYEISYKNFRGVPGDMGGGASRFFLVVKSDPSDINNRCGLEKIKAADTCAGKTTESKSDSLSIDGSGNKPTAKYLLSTISIIETATNSIIVFPISNASTRMYIGLITIESEKSTKTFLAENVESVEVVSDTEASINLNDGRQVLIKGTVSIVLEPNFKNGENKTENSTTPITENTESASRFRYCAKASKRERGEGNGHPTVKPIRLMEYLIKLITPKGGIVLDPFMGSGSTGVAAFRLGYKFIGIELNPEYLEIAKRRIEHASPEASA